MKDNLSGIPGSYSWGILQNFLSALPHPQTSGFLITTQQSCATFLPCIRGMAGRLETFSQVCVKPRIFFYLCQCSVGVRVGGLNDKLVWSSLPCGDPEKNRGSREQFYLRKWQALVEEKALKSVAILNLNLEQHGYKGMRNTVSEVCFLSTCIPGRSTGLGVKGLVNRILPI